ncbi:MAG: hypothetical protein ACOX8R_02680 [Bacillota bacterium]
MNALQLFLGGGLLTVAGSIIGMCLQRHWHKQDKKEGIETIKTRLDAVEAENCLLCYGLSACLDGLEQLGANHTVPAAKSKLDKHLNKKAHGLEE